MKLEELNDLSSEEAESIFRDCCGSREWARLMTEARPFPAESSLFDQAEKFWRNIGREDRLEAFASHPQIGAKIGAQIGNSKAAPAQPSRFAEWSKGEQAGVDETAAAVREELAEANRLYREKFGYIFIVCATGKNAEEMRDICRERLSNSADDELPIAAEEQKKITEIRLKKLLAK
jgi:OHCU decarboxylase